MVSRTTTLSWSGGVVELSNRRNFELWKGGLGVVVESSNCGMVEFVELSNRRNVECSKGGVGGVVDSLNGGMVEVSNRRIVHSSNL